MKARFRRWLAPVSGFLAIFLLYPVVACGQNSNAAFLTITRQQAPQISVSGLPGLNYQLQYASNLTAGTWQSLTNFTMGAGPFSVVDHDATSVQMRMYRALLLQTNASVSYAPDTLSAAEIYRFNVPGNGGIPISDILVLNSPTDALVFQQTSPLTTRSPSVLISYSRIGSFVAQLNLIRLASEGFPNSQTNYYTLVFTGPSTGFFQVTDGAPSSVQLGEFTRDASFIGQQIAPSQLTAGESYGFLFSTNSGLVFTNLVINAATNGMLISQANFLSNAEISPVTIYHTLLGPLTCQIRVVFPTGNGFPSPRTNLYFLSYSSTNGGFYQGLLGMTTSMFGSFLRNDSLVGQQVALPELVAGEIYNLITGSLFGFPDRRVLAINSPTNGMLISPYPNASILAVNILYTWLGPLSCQMEVVVPANSGYPAPKTNLFLFVYSSTNGGSGQVTSTSAPDLVTGTLVRDQSLVGKQIAGAQPVAGQVYTMLTSSGGPTNTTVLVINSATNGLLCRQSLAPSDGIFPVSLEYTPLGLISCQLQVVILPSAGFPTLQTNSYTLIYTTTNGGSCQSGINPSVPEMGSFTRSQSLVGQQIAPALLEAGQNYNLFSGLSGILAANSSTNGMFFGENSFPYISPGVGIFPVSTKYTLLSSLSCLLEVGIPSLDGFSLPRTNLYLFVYSATNGGYFQITNTTGPEHFSGPFVSDRSLVGLQPSPTQLTTGESYRFTATNIFPVITDAIVVNSTTSGILVAGGSGPDSGVIPNVALQYNSSGILSAEINAVIPPGPPAMVFRTNFYQLIYTATNAGLFQRTSSPSSVIRGRFTK